MDIVIQGDDLTNNDKDNITVDTNELKTIMQREILEVFFNDNKDNKVNLFVNAIIYFQMTKIDKDTNEFIIRDAVYHSKVAEKLQSKNQIIEWIEEDIERFINKIDE